MLFLLILAIYQTVKVNPGDIPFYWGFRHGDTDIQRRRYCLMCNVFKPDRCHHCSLCQKCILNMDHHCPWINTCIGFYNRKYFIQMLIYINCLLVLSVIINMKYFISVVDDFYFKQSTFKFSVLVDELGLIFLYLLDVTAMIVLVQFLRFHLKMICDNKTTIETIENKSVEFDSMYNLGWRNNLEQVMGTNVILWFIPMRSFYGEPVGNGIDWTFR